MDLDREGPPRGLAEAPARPRSRITLPGGAALRSRPGPFQRLTLRARPNHIRPTSPRDRFRWSMRDLTYLRKRCEPARHQGFGGAEDRPPASCRSALFEKKPRRVALLWIRTFVYGLSGWRCHPPVATQRWPIRSSPIASSSFFAGPPRKSPNGFSPSLHRSPRSRRGPRFPRPRPRPQRDQRRRGKRCFYDADLRCGAARSTGMARPARGDSAVGIDPAGHVLHPIRPSIRDGHSFLFPRHIAGPENWLRGPPRTVQSGRA